MPLAWQYPFQASLFHIAHDSYDYDLMPLLKNFLLTPLCGALQSCFQSDPALANADLDAGLCIASRQF